MIRAIQFSVFSEIFADGSRAQLAPTAKSIKQKIEIIGQTIECLWCMISN